MHCWRAWCLTKLTQSPWFLKPGKSRQWPFLHCALEIGTARVVFSRWKVVRDHVRGGDVGIPISIEVPTAIGRGKSPSGTPVGPLKSSGSANENDSS